MRQLGNQVLPSLIRKATALHNCRSYCNSIAALLCSTSSKTQLTPLTSRDHCLTYLTPMVQSVRGVKPNTRRPKIPHKERAVVIQLAHSKFKWPLDGLPPTETCINAVKASVAKNEEEVHVNPFERILSQEFLAEVEAAPMFVIVHRHPCTSEDLFEMRVQLHRANMKYMYHNNTIVKLAFADSKYKNLLHLYRGHCATVLCFDKDIAKLLKLERRLPYITILCCVVEGRILEVPDLLAAAELPGLPEQRARLLGALRGLQQGLLLALGGHQVELTGALTRYVEGASASIASDVSTAHTDS